ncbi:unnamed protein product [Camellia sinensis]
METETWKRLKGVGAKARQPKEGEALMATRETRASTIHLRPRGRKRERSVIANYIVAKGHFSSSAQLESSAQTMAPAMPSLTSKEILSGGGVICPPMITTKSLTWRLLEAEERKASSTGKFGKYGGRFVPETLMTCLDKLGAEFNLVLLDAKFQDLKQATGAGQHGVATSAACAKLCLECIIFMGSLDMERRSSNVKYVDGRCNLRSNKELGWEP